jgi:hypothetical protein
MFSAKNSQRTLLLSPPVSTLRREVQAFLIDRQARGLSPGTVSYYADKLEPLLAYLEAAGVCRVQDINAGPPEALSAVSGHTAVSWRSARALQVSPGPSCDGGKPRRSRRIGVIPSTRSPRLGRVRSLWIR